MAGHRKDPGAERRVSPGSGEGRPGCAGRSPGRRPRLRRAGPCGGHSSRVGSRSDERSPQASDDLPGRAAWPAPRRSGRRHLRSAWRAALPGALDVSLGNTNATMTAPPARSPIGATSERRRRSALASGGRGRGAVLRHHPACRPGRGLAGGRAGESMVLGPGGRGPGGLGLVPEAETLPGPRAPESGGRSTGRGCGVRVSPRPLRVTGAWPGATWAPGGVATRPLRRLHRLLLEPQPGGGPPDGRALGGPGAGGEPYVVLAGPEHG